MGGNGPITDPSGLLTVDNIMVAIQNCRYLRNDLRIAVMCTINL